MNPQPESASQSTIGQPYQYEETLKLVTLVKDAANLVATKGETAFLDFIVPDSRWRQKEDYVFVLDDRGNMLVHPDPDLNSKNVLNLKDVNGKPIIRGLINTVTTSSNKTEGWYHYQWPVPLGLLPRWKSTYACLTKSPSGNNFIVASGIYNDRMELAFCIDSVKEAVAQIELHGPAAFPLFRDPSGPFLYKDEYVFVYDPDGFCLVLPTFLNLEGRNLIGLKDSTGKEHIREMMELAKSRGSGLVSYTLPKPGESVSVPKIAYIEKAKMGFQWVMVGSSYYLPQQSKPSDAKSTMTAPELMSLVKEAAELLEKLGENTYPEFRKQGSKWFHDNIYLFIFSLDGTRVFHAPDPDSEGDNDTNLKDSIGRPLGQMILNIASLPSGQGWIHYMYPEPGSLFPVWKSAFLKRVTYPSGKSYIIGSGIYKMKTDKMFIEDVVNRAAQLISKQGKAAFTELRDKNGSFYFMDTYVFVDTPDYVELVNPAFPTLEGKNLIDVKDLNGKAVLQEYISAAMSNGSAWVDYYWYKPGTNSPARKQTFVRRTQFGGEIYIVGSGYYLD